MEAYYIPRDISWLHFNERVLQEAADRRNPLYERIKFLAIYSSNLDEFFRVRVPAVRSLRKYAKATGEKILKKPGKQLREIRNLVKAQQQLFGRIFQHEILPELEAEGIFLLQNESYTQLQRQFARTYFEQHLKDNLETVELEDEGLFLKNKALYFVIDWKEDHPLTLVNIPTDRLPRFVEMPSPGKGVALSFLDDILRFNLPDLFPDRYIRGMYAVKLSRDADLNIEDEYSGDLIEKIKTSLAERDYGSPTRFLYDSQMPEALIKRLRKVLKLSKYELIPGGRYHNFNDFFSFPDPTENPELHKKAMPPLPHPQLEDASSILKAIADQDQVLHFPYQRFDYLMQMLEEAIQRPEVTNFKITLYRVAGDSQVCESLLRAVEAGKSVTVFVEAKARFDEASNLSWGARLAEAGAKVIYSKPGIKVHTKLLLITEKASAVEKHYAYIGTGNFNEKTARLYCDHALLTFDQRLTLEVAQVFRMLETGEDYPFQHLLVAPKYLRPRFLDLIREEIRRAEAGEEAYMILKMNSLENREMIDAICEAHQAGVKVQLLVRGICSLVPGVEGVSDGIEAWSILDRFLEHARVYIFGNGGEEKMYIASADWMTRNLKRRVEVAAPVYDPEVYAQIRQIIQIQLNDNTKARTLGKQDLNQYKRETSMQEAVRAQYDTYDYIEQLMVNKQQPTSS